MKKNRCIISGTDVALLPFGYNEDSRECQTVKNNILNAIIRLFKENGVDEFYTDCSFGFPLWGGEIVTGLMLYNDIRLYVVFPYENQPFRYTVNWRDRFYKVHKLSTDVIPMYTEQDTDGKPSFSTDKEMLDKKAADYMLADCGRLLFCGDGRGCYLYDEAVRRGCEVLALNVVNPGGLGESRGGLK